MNKLIIVTGGTASGKTTIAKKLKDELKDDAVILKLDDYYNDLSHLSHEERKEINYDHPSSFEWKLIESDLKKILNNEEINVPIYDYIESTRTDKTTLVKPKKVIIFEGILSAYEPLINKLAHMIVFVETASDIRLLRRIKRDVEERGRSLDNVLSQWENTVKPMHNQFIAPTKRYAHVIIPEGGENDIGLSILYAGIKRLIK